jgi:hypothetical protein
MHQRCELEDALARLSRPAADATWETTAQFEQFIITVAQMKHLFQNQFTASSAGSKYPSQTGTLPESAWQSSISGVRLNYEPVKIDLTPIDTSLCRSFAQAIGSERFTEAG